MTAEHTPYNSPSAVACRLNNDLASLAYWTTVLRRPSKDDDAYEASRYHMEVGAEVWRLETRIKLAWLLDFLRGVSL